MSELLTVSYSEIKRWRFCRQSHYYQYVEGITPRVKAKPLKIGNIVHKCIETWAKTGKYDNILREVTKKYKGMFEEEQEMYGNIPEIIQKMMTGYLERYGSERKTYALVEETIGPIQLTKETQFKMRTDRLMRTQRGLALCETKTARKLPDEDLRIWDLQTLLYVWALRESGQDIKAILWDYIRTKLPAVPETLKDGSLSKRANIDTDYATYLAAVKATCPDRIKEYREILDKLKEGSQNKFYRRIMLPVNEKMILPVLADAKVSSLEIAHFRKIPVRTISGFTCPRCFYSSLCYASLRGLDTAFIREREYMDRKEEIEYGEEGEEED